MSKQVKTFEELKELVGPIKFFLNPASVISTDHVKENIDSISGIGLTLCHFAFKYVKMVILQPGEMHREHVVGFPLFTKAQFSGDAQLKTLTKNGVQSQKFSILTENGATVLGE